MHPEIEKLIDLAIADGQITEKERNVILKKAAEFGVDIDEVEMVLDGKLHQLEANKPKEKEKVGNIKTCPACGSSVKTMDLNCRDCNHEFSSIVENYSIIQLMEKMQKVNIDNYEDKDNYYKKIASIIKSSIIPNTANDIYEFGIKAVSEIDSQLNHWREDSTAWKNKAEDCILKLRIIETKDSRYAQLRLELEKSLDAKVNRIKKNDRNDWMMILIIIIIIALGLLTYKFLSKN
jgi:hypothetical protein